MGKITRENWQELSQSDVCAIFGIQRSTINGWRKLGMPIIEKDGKNWYSPKAIFDWRRQQDEKKYKTSSEVDGDLVGESTDALDEYRRIKTQQAKFDLEEKKKKYISVEDHNETILKAAAYVRTYLQNLGKKVSLKVAKMRSSSDIRDLIEKEHETALRRMATEYEIVTES